MPYSMQGPHVCPRCEGENYYGRLVHRNEEEAPACPNHKDEVVLLVPTAAAREVKR